MRDQGLTVSGSARIEPRRRFLTLCAQLLAMCLIVSSFGSVSPVVAADAHGADAVEDDESRDHSSGGPLGPEPDLALWSLVTFLVFLAVLRKFAWTPLIDGLDKREANLREELAEAQAARDKAVTALREREAELEKVQDEVREILAEARRDADHTKNEIVTAAQKEAQATEDRARQDIQLASQQASKELFDGAAAMVAAATEHVLGRSLNDDDQSRLIDEALAQVSG